MPSSSRFDQASATILNRLNDIEALIKSQHGGMRPQLATNRHIVASEQIQSTAPSSRSVFLDGAQNLGQPPGSLHLTGSPQGDQLNYPTESFSPETQFSVLSPGVAKLDGEQSDEDGSRVSTDVPPSSAALLKASEMTIESVLQWPILKTRIVDLDLSVSTPLMEVMGRLVSGNASHLQTENTDARLYTGMIEHLDTVVVENLIENFLLNNHIVNPVLDPELLRRDGRLCVETGLRWDGKSCLIVRVKISP